MNRLCLLLALLTLLVPPAVAQVAALLDDPDAALEKAQEKLKTYDQAESEDDKRWKSAVEQRIRVLQQLLATRKAAQALDEETLDAKALAQRTEQAAAELKRARGLKAGDSTTLTRVDELPAFEKSHTLAKEARDQRRQARENSDSRLKAASEELGKLSGTESEAKKRLAALTKDDDLTRYRVDSTQVELRWIKERTELLNRTVKVLTSQQPVLQVEFDAAELVLKVEEQRLALARDEVTRLRKVEAERIKGEADEEARKAALLKDDPIAQFRAECQAQRKAHEGAVADLKSDNQTLADRMARYKSELEDQNKEYEQLVERLTIGDEGAAGLLSRTEKRNRLKLKLLKARSEEVQTEMAENQSKLVTVLDAIFDLQIEVELNPRAQRLIEKAQEGATEEQAQARADEAVRAFEEERGPLLEQLRFEQTEREGRARTYGSLSLTLAKTRNALEEMGVFVQEHIYWIWNEEPIGTAVFRTAVEEVKGVLARAEIVKNGFKGGFANRPIETGLTVLLALLLTAALFFVPAIRRRRLAHHTVPSGKEPETLGWQTALRRTLWSIFLAGLPALALLAIGWLLRRLNSDLTLPILLGQIAFWYFIWKLSAYLLSPRGVAVRYMGLGADLARQLHISVRLLALAGMAFRSPAIVLEGLPFRMDALPRLLKLGSIGLFVVSLLLVLRPRGALAVQLTRPGGWLRRIWFVIGPALMLVLVGSLAMSVMGYSKGADFLILNALRTAGGVFLLVVLYRLLLKGVEGIANEVRRRTMKKEGATAAWESWEQIRGQLTRIVATLVFVIAVVVLLRSWSADNFLLGYLGEVKLIEITPDQWLTLWDVLVAILWIAAGHFLVRNLAAFNEFVIVPLAGQGDRGGRFVALTFARYGILIFAYGAALYTLGLDYSKLAWLATALSVGIGFGLQEIVANFISGLILLVERPVSVGETVTVGGMEGAVEKISMRATTIINWDKQTIIIPNKNFITQDLINWTRNQNLMRRKILVGVAYGSDVTRVLEVLGKIAASHPKVLPAPPVRIFFVGFGESSLDFEVWIYTRVDDGLTARSELYQQIYAALVQEGIEIPLPQRDLHLRSNAGSDGNDPAPEPDAISND